MKMPADSHDFSLRSVDRISNPEACRIAEAIVAALPAGATGGGCRAFWMPETWRARGEKYGEDSVLVVVCDGGDLAPYFNYDYGDGEAIETMKRALSDIGYYSEDCCGWYHAVYPKAPVEIPSFPLAPEVIS